VTWIAPFILLSIGIAAYARASGAEHLIALAFEGSPRRMIVAAALIGALSPFCSCGVIPLVAGLLGAGVPLAPVVAFWISSPLMDPEMFVLMAVTLGLPFTIGKTLAAIGLGLIGGFATLTIQNHGGFANPLREDGPAACGTSEKDTRVVWKFWREPARWADFRAASNESGWFLGKWLTLAFLIESLMVAYIPAAMISDWIGSGAWWTVPAAVFVGIPTYLNGYAAIPLMASLIDMGMMPGAGRHGLHDRWRRHLDPDSHRGVRPCPKACLLLVSVDCPYRLRAKRVALPNCRLGLTITYWKSCPGPV
jgi:uncharacterized membrane protein YraQ (UPF0718 family)